MEALAEIQYEIGCRIRVHFGDTVAERPGKWKDCAKRIKEKEGGRVVTSAHLRLKNISSAIGKARHLRASSLSFVLWGGKIILGPLDSFSDSLPPHFLSPSLSSCWLGGWGEIRPETQRLFQHTAVYDTRTALGCRCIQWRAQPINRTGPHHLFHCCFPAGNDFI